MIKKYHAPATPYEQLLADDRVGNMVKEQLRTGGLRTLLTGRVSAILCKRRSVEQPFTAVELPGFDLPTGW